MSWRALAVIVVALGCAQPARFPMRAEIDRSQWTVRDCGTGQTYGVIFPSGLAFRFYELEAQARLAQGEPAVFEFEAAFMPPLFPWNDPDTVGVFHLGSLTQGTCAAQPPSRTP